MPHSTLPDILRGTLWQADQLSTPDRPGEPSGHAMLDAELPGGGWPRGALTELLLDSPGHGELRLLAPLLARVSQGGQSVVCIDPPCRPHGPALAGWGLDLGRVLWVHGQDPLDAFWAADQALTARCGIVLCWSTETSRPRPGASAPQGRARSPTGTHETALRRLHLKAQDSEGLLFLIRPTGAATRSSPAPLRVHCQPWPGVPTHLAVHLLKRRGPVMPQPLRLDTRAWLSEALLQRLDRQQATATSPLFPPRTAIASPPARHAAVAVSAPA